MCVTADCELCVVRNLHLHHRCFIVDDLLDRNNDLVDIFPVDLLAVLEALGHVVDKLLRHLLVDMCAVVFFLNGHGVEVETLCGGGLVADLDGSEESQLPHDLLAFFQLETGILVVGVEFDTLLEVVDGVLGSNDSCLCQTAAVVCLSPVEFALDA